MHVRRVTGVRKLLDKVVKLRLVEGCVLFFRKTFEDARLIMDADEDHTSISCVREGKYVFGYFALLIDAGVCP